MLIHQSRQNLILKVKERNLVEPLTSIHVGNGMPLLTARNHRKLLFTVARNAALEDTFKKRPTLQNRQQLCPKDPTSLHLPPPMAPVSFSLPSFSASAFYSY